jgi:hypothetical protein
MVAALKTGRLLRRRLRWERLVVYARDDGEVFMFFFLLTKRMELLRHLGRMASDYHSPFTWYDAAVMSQRVREMS